MLTVPPHQGMPCPTANGLTDHGVGEPLHYRVALPGRMGLKNWSDHIPLQQVHGSANSNRQVGKLVAQQTLARAGQPCKAHEPLLPGKGLQLPRYTRIGLDNELRLEVKHMHIPSVTYRENSRALGVPNC
jgi:hypothetical protein